MLTRKGMTGLLSDIMATGGLTETMEGLVQKLKDDFDEREGILAKYGEAYDGESDEYTFVEKPNEWEGRYRQLEGRYREKFFENSGTRNIDIRDTTILDQTAVKEDDSLDDILYG